MPIALPKYTREKRKGNIGEALVQYLLSHFCLVHKIDGSYDVGNDFICELIKDQSPTNLLFYVQVKFSVDKPKPRRETLAYWRSSPIPVFLFWVKENPLLLNQHTNFERIQSYYRRYTPILHRPDKHKKEEFKPYDQRSFIRDLIIDYERTQYQKGFTPIVEPRDFLNMGQKIELGLPRYSLLIKDVVPEYKERILRSSWVNLLTSALLLEREDKRKSLKQALELLRMARALSSRDKRSKAFQAVFSTHEDQIKTKLANID